MGSGREIVGFDLWIGDPLILLFKDIEFKSTFSMIILLDDTETDGSTFASSDSHFLKLSDLSTIFFSGSSDLKLAAFMAFSPSFLSKLVVLTISVSMGFENQKNWCSRIWFHADDSVERDSPMDWIAVQISVCVSHLITKNQRTKICELQRPIWRINRRKLKEIQNKLERISSKTEPVFQKTEKTSFSSPQKKHPPNQYPRSQFRVIKFKIKPEKNSKKHNPIQSNELKKQHTPLENEIQETKHSGLPASPKPGPLKSPSLSLPSLYWRPNVWM